MQSSYFSTYAYVTVIKDLYCSDMGVRMQDELLYDGFIFMLLRNDTLKLFNKHLYY